MRRGVKERQRSAVWIKCRALGFGVLTGVELGAVVGVLYEFVLIGPADLGILGALIGAFIGALIGLAVGLLTGVLLTVGRHRLSRTGARVVGAASPILVAALFGLPARSASDIASSVVVFGLTGAPFGAWRAPRVLFGKRRAPADNAQLPPIFAAPEDAQDARPADPAQSQDPWDAIPHEKTEAKQPPKAGQRQRRECSMRTAGAGPRRAAALLRLTVRQDAPGRARRRRSLWSREGSGRSAWCYGSTCSAWRSVRTTE